MSELLLKHSLLLTHGTVYGQVNQLAPYDLEPKSINIDQWDNPAYDWKSGLFEVRVIETAQAGAVTDNTPVDVIHWSGTAVRDLSLMVSWRSCMKLLRHI